jgi:hypothetical protein
MQNLVMFILFLVKLINPYNSKRETNTVVTRLDACLMGTVRLTGSRR